MHRLLIDKASIELRSGYDRSSHRVAMTDRATEWLDAVPARDAVPGEGKLSAQLTDEVEFRRCNKTRRRRGGKTWRTKSKAN